MAETPLTGLTASVKIEGVVLGYCSGVDLTLEKDMIEILSFATAYKEKVPTIKDWSASIDGTVAFATGGAQKALYDAYDAGTLIELGVYLNDAVYFTGSGYVQSMSVSTAPDDKANLTAEISGSGAIILTIPA